MLEIDPSFVLGNCSTTKSLLHPGNSDLLLSEVAWRKAHTREGPCSDVCFNKVTWFEFIE